MTNAKNNKGNKRLTRATAAAAEAATRFIDSLYESIERETARVATLVKTCDTARKEELAAICCECREIATAAFCAATAGVQLRDPGDLDALTTSVAEMAYRAGALRRDAEALLKK